MTGRLTDRQLECLQLSATMTDKDIGRHLGISHHTVSLHIREAMRRLQVSSRKAALRRIAFEPLYGSEAITAAAGSRSDRSAPGDPGDDMQGTIWTRTGAWLLPPPPRRSLRPGLILIFAAVAALITVGIVNVVSGAVGALASLAPPTADLTQD
ncbi:MAG: helix-turn-helix transcriptional regulator [Brevundimonas sp.]|uniref:helix-turn-helix domain-containing protein n=1 Tax=Brevundimonas sp. TaxID=1871086 RepID=UPI00260DD406|nr:helix-turn-helix transcriptional regulator [Brevundimonas sp.]MDI6623321.1 helix-turn-helix transcriptional regulator [Brevundimonas sp.]MDQ7813241.1 helix-turn-helix transcriptional regulator [Brevundimonas sp.]